MLAALLEAILEMAGEVVFEILGDLVWGSMRDELDQRGWTGSVFAVFGFILLGGVAGMLARP